MSSIDYDRVLGPVPEGYEVVHDSRDENDHGRTRVLAPLGYDVRQMMGAGNTLMLASTSLDKLLQNTGAIHNFPLHSEYVTNAMGSVEDSQETPDDAFKIVSDKLAVSAEAEWAGMDADTQTATLRSLGQRNENKVIIYSEDRGMSYQISPDQEEALKAHPIWDAVRDKPLVDQVFKPGIPFPGYRLKEMEQICGGTINFLDMLDSAFRDLGIETPKRASRIVYAFRKGLSAKHPTVYVETVETDRTPMPVTESHRQQEQDDETFDLDCLDIPHSSLGNPDNLPLRQLWDDRSTKGRSYWGANGLAQRSFRALMKVCDIPQLDRPKTVSYIRHPQAQIISNRDIGLLTNNPINSLADLENIRLLGNGYRIEEPLTGPTEIPQLALLKRMEMRLFASFLATVKPLGDRYVKDRPVVIDRSLILRELKDLTNAGKFKTVHGRLNEVFHFADNAQQVGDFFDQGWKEGALEDNPSKVPAYDLDDWASLEALSGVDRHNRDFRVGFLGSASSPLIAANRDAYTLSTLIAMAGLPINCGGGTRYIMQKFILGHLDAWMQDDSRVAEHYSFRTPFVSRKEGSLEAFLQELGVMEEVVRRGKNLQFLEKFNVYSKDYLGSRQHGVLGSSDVVLVLPGGAGTAYEYYAVMVHNLMVRITGEGLFPGLNNDRQIPLIFVNSTVQNRGKNCGFHDAFLSTLSDEEQKLCRILYADRAEEAATSVLKMAQERGRPVFWGRVPKPTA